jgi:hypothetical protein
LLHFQSLYAQQGETAENIDNAGSNLGSKTNSLNKYSEKLQKIQQYLLKKLRHRGERLFKNLAAKDSSGYLQYVNQGISYDSISTLSNDTNYQQKFAGKKNAANERLRGEQRFTENQQRTLGTVSDAAEKAGIKMPKKRGQFKEQLNSRQDIDNLIGQRPASLESLSKSQNIKRISN